MIIYKSECTKRNRMHLKKIFLKAFKKKQKMFINLICNLKELYKIIK
jgi:hypothetical protein